MSAPPSIPTTYAAHRAWSVTEIVEISRYTNLRISWQNSTTELARITNHLESSTLPTEVRTLAVVGSLGRMEFSDASDCDLVVVLSNDLLRDDYPDDKARLEAEGKAKAIYDQVWEILEPLNIKPPKPSGTFSTPTSQTQLCSTRHIGNAQEDMRLLAKRQLLLLESQPVYRPDEYDALTVAVLSGYAKGYVKEDPRKEWSFLINDLVRYFRSLCVNYQWDFNQEQGKWPLRNVKLRHSRLVMFTGLLLLLGECSKERKSKEEWLLRRLKLTPLERIAYVYQENGDTSFFRVAGFYDTFLGMLSDTDVRNTLNAAEEGSYQKRYGIPYYAALKANSDGLVAELLRFVFDRRGDWTERFFEYLIF